MPSNVTNLNKAYTKMLGICTKTVTYPSCYTLAFFAKDKPNRQKPEKNWITEFFGPDFTKLSKEELIPGIVAAAVLTLVIPVLPAMATIAFSFALAAATSILATACFTYPIAWFMDGKEDSTTEFSYPDPSCRFN